MLDRWRLLRQDLFGNIEPEVTLANKPNENIVADCASVSYGTELEDNDHKKRLIGKLIKKGHHVPLEFCVFQFKLTGISKSCSSQIARHRMSSQVSSSRRYRTQDAKFVYPMLSEIEDRQTVWDVYNNMSNFNESSIKVYNFLREEGASKQDARRVIPVCSAVEKYLSINARSLRNFFHLRLTPNAEPEIRRLATIILGIVTAETPTLFQDIYHQEVGQ